MHIHRWPQGSCCSVAILVAAVALTGCTGAIGGGTFGPTKQSQSRQQQICGQLAGNRSIAIDELHGLGGALVDAATDRVQVTLSNAAAADPGALRGQLAQAGFCALTIDTAHRQAAVRFDPAIGLTAVARQLATIDGVLDVRLDPVLRGADGDGGGDDGAGGGDGDGKKKGGSGQGGGGNNDHGEGGDDGAAKLPSVWHLAALRMGPALDIEPSAAQTVLALLDTGVDPTTPGLETVNFLPGYDFINGKQGTEDDNGHGTLLAGIIAASSASPFPGVAPGVSILPVKVLDSQMLGSESALIAGIDFAVQQGAQVISMSLAFPDGFVPSYELSRAVREANDKGVVLVAAAGNAGDDEIGYPAAFGQVMAVGGVRPGQKLKYYDKKAALEVEGQEVAAKMVRAEYSQYGAAIDFAAPGGSKQVDEDGDGFPDAIPAYSFLPNDPSQHQGYLIAGTSPATAQAAGITALLLAAGAKPSDALQLLLRGAHSLNSGTFSLDTGAGEIDAARSLFLEKKGQIPHVPARFVNPVVALADDPQGNRRALALIELIDGNNQPVAGSTVLGHFRGAVKHDWQTVTDSQGRALVVSLPAPPGSTVFELGVDKVIEPLACNGDDQDNCDDAEPQQQIIIPKEFSRFERATFRFLSAFMPSGQGPEPTPFMVFVAPDSISAQLPGFASNMLTGPQPTPDHTPVTTIPSDVASYAVVPSLQARSFGPAAGGASPVVMAFDRTLLNVNCSVASAGIPIGSVGSGLGPSPIRLAPSVTSQPLTNDQIIMTASDLFLNGTQVTAAQLGLLFGAQGTVLVGIDGSICVPQGFSFSDTGLMATPVATMTGGLTVTVDANAPPPPPASGSYPLSSTALATGNGQAIFATAASVKASAAVQGP